MNKILLCLFILGGVVVSVSAEPPAVLVDGVVNYAVATVNGKEAYSTKEKNDLTASMSFATAPAPVVVEFTPTEFEIYIATSFKYPNYSAFKSILNTPKKDLDAVKKRLEDDSILKNFKN